MGFLDLFRPKWKHSDPNVRLEAIKDLSADDDLPRLVQVARHDRDVRVRRIAVKKIDDPDLLIEVAQAEPDDDLRRDAVEKAAELLLSAALQADGAGEAAAAIARIQSGDASRDERTLSEVVCRARLSEARHLAFDRLREPRSFADVVRRSQDAGLRATALDKLRDEELLADLLMADTAKGGKELPKELSSRALERVSARDLLTEISQRGRTKALRSAAREKLGLSVVSDEAAPKTGGKGTARPAEKAAVGKPALVADRREPLCQRLEIAAKSDDPADYADVDDVISALRAEWRGVPGDAPTPLRKRFERAISRLQQRRDALVKRSPSKGQGDSLSPPSPSLSQRERGQGSSAPHLEGSASPLSAQPQPAEPRRSIPLPQGERTAEADPAKPIAKVIPELSEQEKAEQAARAELRKRRDDERLRHEAEQAERIQKEAARRAEEDQRRQEDQARNLARLSSECDKLEKLAQAETLKGKSAEQALKAAHEVIVAANPLPRETGPAARKRYDAARAALVIRLNDLRDKEEWQRFANVPKLEELCLQMEALWAEVEKRGAELEPDVVLEVLRTLQTEWKKVGPAPKDKSETLWARFKDQGDRVYDRLKQGSEAERTANLAKKEGLCQKVEALLATLVPASPSGDGAATEPTANPPAARIDWKAVSDGLKALQAEWKTVGLLPTREQGEALWQRFKAAADKVHTEQKGHYAELDSERAENAKKKEALCIRAESLQYGNDWKGTGEAIKQLQADWKALGPAPKDQNEALWTRFRAACDKFFERRQAAFAEQDLERGENAKKKDGLCQQAEALAGKDDVDQDTAESEVKRLMGEWKRIGPAPKADNETLWKRFRAACDQVFERGRSYTMPVTEGGEKFSNKLPLAAALAKAAEQSAEGSEAAASSPASEISPTWAEDSASAWADIESELATPDKK